MFFLFLPLPLSLSLCGRVLSHPVSGSRDRKCGWTTQRGACLSHSKTRREKGKEKNCDSVPEQESAARREKSSFTSFPQTFVLCHRIPTHCTRVFTAHHARTSVRTFKTALPAPCVLKRCGASSSKFGLTPQTLFLAPPRQVPAH